MSESGQRRTDSDLMEASVEEFFDFRPFEGDRLKLSFVVVVKERQSLSSICRKTHKVCVKQNTIIYVILYYIFISFFLCDRHRLHYRNP